MFRIVALTLSLLLISITLVTASVGISLTPAAITLDKPLQPGREYRLPPVTIGNHGTDNIDVNLYLSNADGCRLVPRSKRITLKPSEHKTVFLSLSLPSNLKPGSYNISLEAEPQTEGNVTLQLATPIEFTVSLEDSESSTNNYIYLAMLLSLPLLTIRYINTKRGKK